MNGALYHKSLCENGLIIRWYLLKTVGVKQKHSGKYTAQNLNLGAPLKYFAS